jgi:hypothetical protein
MGTTTKLAPGQHRALAALSRLRALRGFYLAGGSAVAYHLGHRRSNDLDLFSRDAAADLDAVSDELGSLGGVKVLSATDTMLKVRLGQVPIDIVRYRYPLLEAPAPAAEGVPIAGLLDLATMKLAAISSRGIGRDFWDLHEIVTRSSITLPVALAAYLRRFGISKADLYHVLRALTYFADAEKERLPTGLTPRRWKVIKEYFVTAAPNELLRRAPRRGRSRK